MGLANGKPIQERLAQPFGHGALAEPHEHHYHQAEQPPFPPQPSPAAPEKSAAPGDDYFAHLARATNDAVRDWNVSNGTLSWPHGLDSLLGYIQLADVLDVDFWQQLIHPADRARVLEGLRDAFADDTDRWSGEYRLRRADGAYLQILERALILRDSQGKPVRLVGSLMDITARKQLQDQLVRSQKMEAFGQLAGGVAHDFNNFLTTILGYSDLILGEMETDTAIASHVSEIRSAAGRASVLAGQLLAFSRKQALEPHVVEVNSFITNLERSLLRLLGDNITVVSHLHRDKEGAHIKVDPGQLTQILLNLAVNARDAMRGGGRLTLETSVIEFIESSDRPSGLDEIPDNVYVVLRVIDNGTGMTDEVKAHVFEPFFTTKHDSHASGLGLATSYGIIRQSGGRIRIDSELGKGTKVEIYLPRVPAPPPPAYRKPSERKLPKGTETVLVLEDDISVRHMSVKILRGLGYEVVEAANGDDAQRFFGEKAERNIQLLLTDMVMPQMSGRCFADWLHTVSPETRVVFVSGYMKESLHPGDQIDHGMFFLPKPFDPEQLAQTVRQALDA